jgi:surfeit locus 1 family protein
MPFRLPGPVLFALILLATIAISALGVWQLQRNEWKQDLVAHYEARSTGTAIDALASATLEPAETNFRLVDAHGTWDYANAMTLANRVRHTSRGEELVVPLVLQDGGPALLVNRGWFPEGTRDRAITELQARDQVAITGLARDPGDREARVIQSGAWNTLVPTSMGATLPYPVLPWYVIEGERLERLPPPGSPIPVQGWFPFQNTTPHVQYAITWFSIAATLLVVATIRFVVAPRRASRTDARRTSRGSDPD